MKFTPFKFQVPLAAGGIALMAFNYLQFAVPHGKGLIKSSDIPWARLTTGQISSYLPLIVLMLAFTLPSFGSLRLRELLSKFITIGCKLREYSICINYLCLDFN